MTRTKKKRNEHQSKRKQKRKKNRLIDFFFLIITLAGIGLLLYPVYSDYQLKRSQTLEITKYQENISLLNKEERKKKLDEYDKKNEEQQKGSAPLEDPFAKIEGAKGSNSLDVKRASLPDPVAVLEIPKINLEVQVYPTSNDIALEKGVGVLEGTSLPSGGVGNHSILTGHRGLSLGQMFTDLPNLKIKDQFYVTIMGEIHAYEIDQIETVKPDDLTHFDRVPSEDYITLVTCTPLGINSHRLLVRGHRIPYVAEAKDTGTYWTMKKMLLAGLSGLALLVMIILILKKMKKKKKRRKNSKGGKRKSEKKK